MDVLDVLRKVKVDNSIVEFEYHNHVPFGSPKYGNNDEIRIVVPEIDKYTLPSESELLIEGKLRLATDESKPSATASLIHNAGAFMFSNIRYIMSGSATPQPQTRSSPYSIRSNAEGSNLRRLLLDKNVGGYLLPGPALPQPGIPQMNETIHNISEESVVFFPMGSQPLISASRTSQALMNVSGSFSESVAFHNPCQSPLFTTASQPSSPSLPVNPAPPSSPHCSIPSSSGPSSPFHCAQVSHSPSAESSPAHFLKRAVEFSKYLKDHSKIDQIFKQIIALKSELPDAIREQNIVENILAEFDSVHPPVIPFDHLTVQIQRRTGLDRVTSLIAFLEELPT